MPIICQAREFLGLRGGLCGQGQRRRVKLSILISSHNPAFPSASPDPQQKLFIGHTIDVVNSEWDTSHDEEARISESWYRKSPFQLSYQSLYYELRWRAKRRQREGGPGRFTEDKPWAWSQALLWQSSACDPLDLSLNLSELLFLYYKIRLTLHLSKGLL